ncbi:MAG: hypothetical protein KDC49_11105 [Saprospiraceae bacterium]|nr:hypothetical protein [Saprospiraceae bacterium]
MKFRNNLLLLCLACLVLSVSCSKEEKAFEDINFDDIKDKESSLLSKKIEATNSTGIILKPGTILLFKTNEGRFGKLNIVGFDESSNYDLTIDAVVYKEDKSVLGSANGLVIRGTWLADLDVPKEAAFNEFQTKGDFQLERINDTDSNISPSNGAMFYVY